jgi:YidC/Oxa1 family membrane protein insertase
MQQENSRNTIIFVVCAVAIFILYDLFVLRPEAERRQAQVERAAAAEQVQPGAVAPPGSPDAPRAFAPREQAAAASARVPIETPFVRGSLNLTGARVDDLYLRRYRETIERGSPNVEMFRPEGAENAYFAEFGWAGANLPNLPGPDSRWTLAEGSRLTPTTPVVLTYDNGAGLLFTRRISIDDEYMFTLVDTVVNRSAGAATLAAYGSVQRQGFPPGFLNNPILHEGAVGVLADRLEMIKFNKWRGRDEPLSRSSEGGWLGITDKYWLAA